MKLNFFLIGPTLGPDLARLQFASGMVRGDSGLFVVNGLMVYILHTSFKPQTCQRDISTNVLYIEKWKAMGIGVDLKKIQSNAISMCILILNPPCGCWLKHTVIGAPLLDSSHVMIGEI